MDTATMVFVTASLDGQDPTAASLVVQMTVLLKDGVMMEFVDAILGLQVMIAQFRSVLTIAPTVDSVELTSHACVTLDLLDLTALSKIVLEAVQDMEFVEMVPASATKDSTVTTAN